jgi:two-component system sensor histidine kinase MprB
VSLRNLSFRARLAIVAAGAVALAVVLSSVVAYLVVGRELRRQLDNGLRARASELLHTPIELRGPAGQEYLDAGPSRISGAGGYLQAVRLDGSRYLTKDEHVKLPASEKTLDVARRTRGAFFSDADVEGTRLRVLTVPARSGFALQIARSQEELLHTLSRLTILLLAIAAGGVAIAAGLGLLVARTALRPVRRLTQAAERVRETADLSERIDVEGADELSRLAGSFNAMLEALENSARSQRQLVSDASHELRTPLTSLRTNIEVLALDSQMAPPEREKLLHDVVAQLTEMTALINELVELARGDQHPHQAEDVRLDLLVGEVVDRARRDYPNVEFAADLQESEVHGVPHTIARAVSNLLDNAAKWSPSGAKVEVRVRGGAVTVRDHGPGIDESDLPYVFDRFYRAPAARKLPGSGLGLSIVKQVAAAHGGTVAAERADGGGTRMTLELPETRTPTRDGARDTQPAASAGRRSERTPA